ncbi:MAG: glycosyltransferase family 2 protein [Candidatus Gottesmanbacteria bacterium]|nr:glycosyltransferase family 2 protein [Candidatus Gottesmanbacteria bacterium]
MHTSSLIILTRNELSGLRSLIASIPTDKVDECFAVDYRSTDGTVELFKKHRIRVIHQEKPGRGEAFRLSARHATGQNLIFFSPDGNEDPRDIPKLLKLLNLGFDMTIASRFMNGSTNEEDTKRVKPRAWANRAFTFLANVIFRGHITDSINGYRAITKDAFRRLRLDAEGFAIEYQMTIRALKLHMRIAEFPTQEKPRIGGTSTAHAIPTGLRILRILLREIVIGKKF